jgi:glycosyltransferase involved in cell wall biosynthesis
LEHILQNPPTNITMIQDHHFLGGAARAANRWSDFLETEGLTIQRMTGDQAEGKGLVLTGKPPRGWGRLIEHFTDRRSARKTKVDQCLENMLHKEKPDLIWFHNIAGGGKWGWSEDMIAIARQHAPVLWTLHDMWALGDSRESYWQEASVVESGKWKGAGKSRVEGVIEKPGKYPVTLTAPSQWLADLTKKITGQECVFLPNPIDLKIFSPGDRQAARQRFGLPEKGLVVLAGADSLKDRRKGFDLLREAWKSGSFHDATLALFGRHGESRPGEQYLGNLNSDEELVAAYRAADLYVHPARMENAPCTIQESLACGTPVVAFAVGGIPEMIRPGETGFLAESVNSTSLATTLGKALETPQRLAQMVSACRKYAEKDFDLATQVANLFQMSLGFSR